MLKQLVVLSACLVLAAGCSSKENTAADPKPAGPTKAADAPPSTADCPYRGKSGFCFTPPAGTTPSESGTNVIFERAAEPKAAQDLVISTEDFPVTPELLKGQRDFERKGTGAPGTTVLEDVDIAGGKGFYVATQSSSNVLVTAVVPNGSGEKLYRCTFNAYNTDKDALKNEIQACKSLKAAPANPPG
jgi:hypothetical protein